MTITSACNREGEGCGEAATCNKNNLHNKSLPSRDVHNQHASSPAQRCCSTNWDSHPLGLPHTSFPSPQHATGSRVQQPNPHPSSSADQSSCQVRTNNTNPSPQTQEACSPCLTQPPSGGPHPPMPLPPVSSTAPASCQAPSVSSPWHHSAGSHQAAGSAAPAATAPAASRARPDPCWGAPGEGAASRVL